MISDLLWTIKGAGWKSFPMSGCSGAQLSFSGISESSGVQTSFSGPALRSKGVSGWEGVAYWLEPPWLLELSPQSLSFVKYVVSLQKLAL